MELGKLKKWRFIIPGLLLFVLLKSITSNSATSLIDIKQFVKSLNITTLYYLVPVLLFGIAYYVCDIRWLLWKRFNGKVTDNINEKLITPVANSKSYADVKKMFNSRKVMHIFYHFIDKDKSLEEKSKLVKINGLIWTSFMDITLISFFGALLFFIKWIFIENKFNVMMGIILLGISICFYLLLYPMTQKHIKLSNEQLDQIVTLHNEELIKKLIELC